MSTIVAGHFDQPAQLDRAIAALAATGFGEHEYARYYLNPPGQHDLTPIGGDVQSDAGARHAGKGAMRGATLGGVVGLAVGGAIGLAIGGIYVPVGVLVGVGVGAYAGSLYGALNKTRTARPGRASAEQAAVRSGGLMLAVCTDRLGSEESALSILDKAGAQEIERSEGRWIDGGWSDFDPRRRTEVLKDTSPSGKRPTPGAQA